jgi:hypothetical protein
MSERNRKIAEYLKAIALLIESDSVSQTCGQPLVIPEGWRELSPDEVPRLGDMVEQLGNWHARKSVGSKAYEQHEVRHIRKIEPANPSETPNSSRWIPEVGDRVRVNSDAPLCAGRDGHIKAVSTLGFFTIYFISEDERHCGWVKPEHIQLIEAAS